MTQTNHQIIIVGGGTAGITVAASLKRQNSKLDIAIIEPSDSHYYQPAFTLVGAGAYSLEKTRRSTQSLIPKGVTLISAAATEFDPANNQLSVSSGITIGYDYLVVCPGLELNWNKIKGADSLGRNEVCSNYSPEHVEYTWQCLQNLKPGAKALFTQAPLPFKCPGAPQKMAYLAADYLRKKSQLESSEIHFLTHGPAMFAVPLFAKELDQVADRYGIKVHFQHNLVAIDADSKTAEFEVVGGDKTGERISLEFDMLHFTPPQSPPESIQNSPLANDAGYIDVHQHTMQHNQFKNVFGLGDAGSTPNSKTAAAVRKQAPVVVKNLLSLMQSSSPAAEYDGYGSCPLTTAYGKVIMAEFVYGGKVTPTFPLDPRKERGLNWWIKATGLPLFYWHYMLKGYERFFNHNTDFSDS
ncbi:MAG: FAD/NAD(P)-binding oxidoreductase [Pseudomonadales bacterium]